MDMKTFTSRTNIESLNCKKSKIRFFPGNQIVIRNINPRIPCDLTIGILNPLELVQSGVRNLENYRNEIIIINTVSITNLLMVRCMYIN